MHIVVVLVVALFSSIATAQTIEPPFDADYSYVSLGQVPGLPTPAGGITFVPGDPDTILIGAAANTSAGEIHTIGVTRGLDGHIDGFSGMSTFYADATGPSGGGIDGGLSYGPGGVLFYTSYPDNGLGQLEPGSSVPDRVIALTPLGVSISVGSLVFVPPGFPGAGRMKVVQYNSPYNWYDVALTPDGSGTFDLTPTLITSIQGGPEGVIYVAAGNPQIGAASVIVSEYSAGNVATYEVDANGDPIFATRRLFISALSGAEGAAVDPQTGDFLFSTFGGGNRLIVVRGFLPPPTTTSTSTSTSIPTSTAPTTTSLPTTTTSSITTSSTTSTSSSSSTSSSTTTATTPSTTSTSTTTTTTVPTGTCATVPIGPTFASIACRLADLRTDTIAASALAPIADKLVHAIDKAIERNDLGAGACDEGSTKKAKKQLKKVVRQLIQYSHRLRSRASRRKFDETIREPLAAAADAIQADARTLKDDPGCASAS